MALAPMTLALAAAFGLVWALVVGLNALRLGTAFGVLDRPDPIGGRKRHECVTPQVGGFGAVLPAVLLLFATAAYGVFPNQTAQSEIVWIGAAIMVLMLVGLLDDKYELSARFRLGFSTVVFAVLMLQVPDLYLELLWFDSVDQVLILEMWGGALSLLCLVGFLNALNMMDGKNGLVMGISLFWCIALLTYAPMQLQPMIVCLTVGLTVMLGFNLAGRLFLGDSGSYALSGVIGTMLIYTYSRRPDVLGAEQLLLWLSLPVMDCVRVMASRLARGLSFFHPGRDHFHHYLARHLGWDRGKYVCWALVWVPGLASLVWPAASLALLLVTIAVYALLVRYLVGIPAPAVAELT